MIKPLPIGLLFECVVLDFFFQRRQDQPVDEFPYIGNKPNRLEVPLSVVITEVISFDFLIQNRNGLGKKILTKAFDVCGKSAFVNPEDNETDVP